MEDKKLPVYESPKVVTYTDEELLEELGPAQTGYVSGDSAFQWLVKGWVKLCEPTIVFAGSIVTDCSKMFLFRLQV